MSVVRMKGVLHVEEGEERIQLLLGFDDNLHLHALLTHKHGCLLDNGVELLGNRLEEVYRDQQ